MNSKKISLRGISGILSERELKNVLGGSCSHSGVCSPFYHYLRDDGCYYDGCDCQVCGSIVWYEDSAECIA